MRTKMVPAGWLAGIDGWAGWLVAAGRSPRTIETRTDHVRRLARAMGGAPDDVTGVLLLGWVSGQQWARETRRSVYASVRGFFRWATVAGIVDVDPSSVLPVVAPSPPKPRPAPEGAYRAALQKADSRTGLILRLAGEAGLRRAEIAQVHRDDLVEDLDGWSLMVHGKGGRDRVVPLPRDVARDVRGACMAGAGWMLPSQRAAHLLPRRVGELASEVLPAGWTLHTLRHRYATACYRGCADLLAVQQLLGHTSPTTTQRYVAVDHGRLRAASSWAA